jgi:DNA recombination protein RmuC
VVMFLPTESLLAAALEADPALLEAVSELGVVLATPTTLVALLRAVALAWRHEQAESHAAEAAALGRELFERLRGLTGHFEQMRKGLAAANTAYDRAAASLESRVLLAARRLGELGAVSAHDELPAPRLLDATSDQRG